ncbi:c-type cytochrome [Aestuariirhabdus sp. Z084]|uniref:c-type cytochrome n=1 Tax=Aestuariirhabdus haliotis TaxID=2918751 RepID=UPI00201B4111|nr:c-type cytochrome [Aestuariirhabdus haliotis]MCL6416955.1 c-type cytochrome [Aestuariirhabdus haliotis]MCL6420942.1 c-type cytochrome [Aestuariirhabdus haliotis]
MLGRYFTIAVVLAGYLAASVISTTAYADTVEVSIYKRRFTPQHITVNKGDTVVWINREKRQYHSVWFKEQGEPEPDYFFPDESFQKVFNEEGTFPYECGPHPDMTGSVTVRSPDQQSHSQIDDARQQELTYLVKQDCGSCHGMLLKGGLGPAILPDNLRNYSVDDLTVVILYGRPTTPMPPWKGILSEMDARWIANQLKAGEIVTNEP